MIENLRFLYPERDRHDVFDDAYSQRDRDVQQFRSSNEFRSVLHSQNTPSISDILCIFSLESRPVGHRSLCEDYLPDQV